MKRLLALTALAISAFSLQVTTGLAEGQLKVYHWFEYIPQELVDKFEKETGIDVTIDTFDSNEAMLASLKAGKLGQYDVTVPGDYMVEIMRNEGLLDSYTREEMPSDGPGKVTRKQSTDITAYVFSKNDYPAGPGELEPTLDVLNQILITPKK